MKIQNQKISNGVKKFINIFAALVIIFGLTGPAVFAQAPEDLDNSARTKYQNAWGQYKKEVNVYKDARQDFLNAKLKYNRFKNNENKGKLEENSKKFLKNVISAMLHRLEALRNKAENVRGISDSERTAILAEIDKDITWLKDKQSKIDTATPEQIKELAKEVRAYWKNIRVTAKKVTGWIMAARINFLISKAEDFAAKVKDKIDELKSAGKDTTQLEAWISEFNEKIALAKEKYEAAKAKFQAISSLDDADQLFKEGHQFVKDANQYVRQAHVKLVLITKEIKKMGKETEEETEETATESEDETASE